MVVITYNPRAQCNAIDSQSRLQQKKCHTVSVTPLFWNRSRVVIDATHKRWSSYTLLRQIQLSVCTMKLKLGINEGEKEYG